MDEFCQTAPKIQIGAEVQIIILLELSWNQIWLKSHLLFLKKIRSGVKDTMGRSTRNFLKKDRTKAKFFTM